MPTKETNPIIAEVWAVRDGFAARADYDVGGIFRRIHETQDESGREYVSYPARRIERAPMSHWPSERRDPLAHGRPATWSWWRG